MSEGRYPHDLPKSGLSHNLVLFEHHYGGRGRTGVMSAATAMTISDVQGVSGALVTHCATHASTYGFRFLIHVVPSL